MKQHELHRTRKYSIGVLDDTNFYVAKITIIGDKDANGKPNPDAGKEALTEKQYYPSIASALKCVAKLVANREAATLDGYITAYTSVAKELAAACQGA